MREFFYTWQVVEKEKAGRKKIDVNRFARIKWFSVVFGQSTSIDKRNIGGKIIQSSIFLNYYMFSHFVSQLVF